MGRKKIAKKIRIQYSSCCCCGLCRARKHVVRSTSSKKHKSGVKTTHMVYIPDDNLWWDESSSVRVLCPAPLHRRN